MGNQKYRKMKTDEKLLVWISIVTDEYNLEEMLVWCTKVLALYLQWVFIEIIEKLFISHLDFSSSQFNGIVVTNIINPSVKRTTKIS